MKQVNLKKIIKEEILNVIKENSQWEVETQKFEIALKKWLDYMISQGDTLESLKPEIDRMLDIYQQTGDTLMEDTTIDENKYIGTAGNIKVSILPAGFVELETSSNALSLDRKRFKQIIKMLNDIDWFSDSLTEYIKSNNELEILLNAADDINTQYFKGRGQIDRNNYRLAVRDTEDNVLDTLEKNTKVIKKTKGFTAKEDEEKEYYQLPEFNVSIALDSYKVSRATIIQFLSIDGEKPESNRMYQ